MNTKRRHGYPRVLTMHILGVDNSKTASTVYQQLKSCACRSAAPAQVAGTTCKHPTQTNHGPRLSPPAKPSKTPIRVNHLAFGVCGTYGSLQHTHYKQNYSELIKESFKDDRMAYLLCILILCPPTSQLFLEKHAVCPCIYMMHRYFEP